MPQHQKLNQNKQKYKQKNKTAKKVALSKNKKFFKKKPRNSKDLIQSAKTQMNQRIERELAERASKHGVPIRSFKLADPAVRSK